MRSFVLSFQFVLLIIDYVVSYLVFCCLVCLLAVLRVGVCIDLEGLFLLVLFVMRVFVCLIDLICYVGYCFCCYVVCVLVCVVSGVFFCCLHLIEWCYLVAFVLIYRFAIGVWLDCVVNVFCLVKIVGCCLVVVNIRFVWLFTLLTRVWFGFTLFTKRCCLVFVLLTLLFVYLLFVLLVLGLTCGLNLNVVVCFFGIGVQIGCYLLCGALFWVLVFHLAWFCLCLVFWCVYNICALFMVVTRVCWICVVFGL